MEPNLLAERIERYYEPLPKTCGLPPWANEPSKMRNLTSNKKHPMSAKQKKRKK